MGFLIRMDQILYQHDLVKGDVIPFIRDWRDFVVVQGLIFGLIIKVL